MNETKLNITVNSDDRELLIRVLTKAQDELLESVGNKAKYAYDFQCLTESEILKDLYDVSRALLAFASYKFDEVTDEVTEKDVD